MLNMLGKKRGRRVGRFGWVCEINEDFLTTNDTNDHEFSEIDMVIVKLHSIHVIRENSCHSWLKNYERFGVA